MLVGARSSPLSCAQYEEVREALHAVHPTVQLSPVWVETVGDRDKSMSLRQMDKSDFFTRDLDELLLRGSIRAAIHSAKDLPDPLPAGIRIAAMTAAADPRDCIVVRTGEILQPGSIVATSSARREEAVRELFPETRFVDVRGTIQERLQLLFEGKVDGVVVAEAAIARLKLYSLHRLFLKAPSAPLQGRLAIAVREDDLEMQELFSCLHTEKRPWTILYLGLDPSRVKGRIYHYPVIRTKEVEGAAQRIEALWKRATHLLFTSKSAIAYLPKHLSWEGKTVLAIGQGTASNIQGKVEIAKTSTQEGIAELLPPLASAHVLWPRSKRSRDVLEQELIRRGIAHEIVDLYDTVSNRPGHPPDLNEIDEIMFTSPSCIKGFVDAYGPSLPKKKISMQGPITEAACRKFFGTDMMVGLY